MQDLTTTKLEIVACHILINLLHNPKKTPTDYPTDKCTARSYNSPALHEIHGNRN